MMLLICACNTGETRKAKEEKTAKAFDSIAIKSRINDSNTQFVVDAANAGWARATQGKLAIEKGTTQRIKDFGRMMMTDNKNMSKALGALADAKKIIMPRTMGIDEQIVLDSLRVKEGKAFDKAYIAHMTAVYKAAIKRFEDAAENLPDTDLRAFASAMLPKLKKHLALCESLNQ